MTRILKKTGVAIAGLAAVLLITAVTMVFLPEPTFSKTQPDVPPPWTRPAQGFECVQSAAMQCFTMKDGITLHARRFESGGPVTVVLMHGVLSHGGAFEKTATMIRESLDATVLTLDLRGHGLSGGTPGDVRYIGQYEHDVAEVVAALRKQAARQRIILAGHSMGGGVAMRYAATPGLPEVDGYLLFAPHLGQKSPTTRNQTAPANSATEPTIKVHVPRVMALLLLNVVGISAFNDRDTLYFNLPPRFPINRYTYRAMMSISPDDYVLSLGADSKPLLIVVGRNDEAFDAQHYPEVVKLHRNGRAVILDDESHQTVIHSPAAFAAIERWHADGS